MDAMINSVMSWFNAHQALLTWMTLTSAFTFVASLLALPWLVSRIPENYFLSTQHESAPWKDAHPLWRGLLFTGKNLLGFILLCGGTLMLFLPGQGILTIAMGLLLMDYPGKFFLERKLVASPAVLRGLNWLRARNNHPPLQVDINHTSSDK